MLNLQLSFHRMIASGAFRQGCFHQRCVPGSGTVATSGTCAQARSEILISKMLSTIILRARG